MHYIKECELGVLKLIDISRYRLKKLTEDLLTTRKTPVNHFILLLNIVTFFENKSNNLLLTYIKLDSLIMSKFFL